jgi:hypothetical protein
MSSITKAKVNLKERTIELEGSEPFVSKYLEIFQQQLMTNAPAPDNDPTINQIDTLSQEKNGSSTSEKAPTKKRVIKIPQSVAPTPIDLTAKDGNPSLKDFIKEKNPRNDMERIAVFAYFLKYYGKISDMKVGHVVSCFQEINQPVPTNIPQAFKNNQHRKGWLDTGVGAESAQITIKGENFVKFELPKKDVADNKDSA